MYKIYADGILIYDDTSSDPYLKVVSPKLTMEVNAAGSLSITIPPGNAGYDTISLMTTDISVTKDGEEIWFGRVLQEEKDFWNNRVLTCEGALAFLNDTTQPQASHDISGPYPIRTLLGYLIDEHNSNVLSNRQITLGWIDEIANEEADFETNYETTIDCINKFVLERFGGNIYIRIQNGTLYLDYREDSIRENTQTIEFGKNLMDFTTSIDTAELATVVVPLGKKIETEGDDGGEARYITVEGISSAERASDDPCDDRFVGLSSAIGSYGWIQRVVHFDDCDNADTLYRLAREYLSSSQYASMEISLSALDLHYLSPEIMDVKVGDRLHVVSSPHGLNTFMTVTKMDIPMDQPQNTMFKLGAKVKTSLSSSGNKLNEELLKKIAEQSLDGDAIREAAIAQATEIMNQKVTGFITITSDEYGTNEFYISGSRPLFNDEGEYEAERFWKWNLNGLGYTDDKGKTWKTAITRDGSILGERIVAGSIHGSKITAGTLDIVTSAGDSGLSIGLSPRGMAPGIFAIGNIDQYGKNENADNRARTTLKVYYERGTKITLNNTNYWFEPMEYSNSNDPENIDPENGFIYAWGEPQDRTFTVANSNYFRFVVRRTNNTDISKNELNTIAAAFSISGSSAVIRAQDLHVIGMVRLSDVSEAGDTIINGANIITGTIQADRIDLYSGFTVYRDKVKDDEHRTFAINADGTVYINADVELSSSSVIHFSDPSDDTTLGDIADEKIAKSIANGTYEGTESTFISERVIRTPELISPTITTESLIAKHGSNTNESGVIALQTANGDNKLSIRYTSNQDTSPGIFFSTAATNGEYHFDLPAQITGGITIDNYSPSSLAQSYIHGRIELNSDSSLVINGKMKLLYGVTYVASYSELPSNPEQGQVCFVLN